MENGDAPIHYQTGFIRAMLPTHLPPEQLMIVARREQFLAEDAELYHYTSLGGFQGIIKSGGFWASDNRFMNDSEEIRHGTKFAQNVVRHQMKKATHEFRHVLEKVDKIISEPAKNGSLVACFSIARDSLEQWRGYGPSGAVCLRLGRAKLPLEAPIFFGPRQLGLKVKYTSLSKAITLLSVIKRFAIEYAKDRAAMQTSWPLLHDSHFAKHLYESIAMHARTFKDAAFTQEKEIRIVLPYESAPTYDKLKFRASSFGLIPYICTGDRESPPKQLPLREVIVGPSPQKELIIESIRTFLDYSGYNSVCVTPSKVPFRSA